MLSTAPCPDGEAEFNRLIERRGPMVYKLAFARCGNQADAEDVFQQVFLRYLTKKPHFADAEHEKAWFIKVTVNRSKSLWSSAFQRRTQPLDENMPAEPAELYAQEERADLAAALQKLPEEQRVLIHLFYYEGLPTAEIAQLLNKREGTVRMQLTRARRRLQELLSEGGENEVEN